MKLSVLAMLGSALLLSGCVCVSHGSHGEFRDPAAYHVERYKPPRAHGLPMRPHLRGVGPQRERAKDNQKIPQGKVWQFKD